MALTEADLRLCTTRTEGRLGHLGFSDMCFGRLEGINQYGLCITHSSSWDPVPTDWQDPQGLHFAIAIRAALDQCKSVEEALVLWQSMPIGSNCTFLTADPSGNAAQIEIAGKKRAVKRLPPKTDKLYLVSTNHFTLLSLPDPGSYTPNAHSTRRYNCLTAWLQENQGIITCNDLKAFLDRDWETGISSFSPEQKAGTLWSMVFDVTAQTTEVRFGPPPYNEWLTFSLDEVVGIREYMVEIPG